MCNAVLLIIHNLGFIIATVLKGSPLPCPIYQVLTNGVKMF